MNKKLKLTLTKLLPHKSKFWFQKLKLLLKSPYLALNINTKNNTFNQKIVVISFPRSGSSWVGSILGSADNAQYLREPVTTSYMLAKPKRISVFTPEKCDNWPMYKHYIKQAFSGDSYRLNGIYKYPHQWLATTKSVADKSISSLVFKEVNPLIIQQYQNQASHLLYLVRHPYSVAKSYSALNWNATNLFTKRFSDAEIETIQQANPELFQSNFWHQMGFLLGWIEARTKQQLNSKSITIRYEDICQDPITEFKQIFNRVNLLFNQRMHDIITETISNSATKNIAAGDFSLIRNKTDVTFVKVKTTDKANYIRLMTAYIQAISDYNQINNCQHYSEYQINCQLIRWY